MVKNSQVVFADGKEVALKALFGSSNFGYLALGYESSEDNGFEDGQDRTDSAKGFKELTNEQDSSYERIALSYFETATDPDTSDVIVRFKATLPATNITGHSLNQMAVYDSAEIGTGNMYSATTYPTFNKTQLSSITFVVGFKM